MPLCSRAASAVFEVLDDLPRFYPGLRMAESPMRRGPRRTADVSREPVSGGDLFGAAVGTAGSPRCADGCPVSRETRKPQHRAGPPRTAASVSVQSTISRCALLLHLVRYELWRVGGSNAQRDIVDWTLTEAAVRGGLRDVAVALSNERLGARPRSVVNRQFHRRAEQIAA